MNALGPLDPVVLNSVLALPITKNVKKQGRCPNLPYVRSYLTLPYDLLNSIHVLESKIDTIVKLN